MRAQMSCVAGFPAYLAAGALLAVTHVGHTAGLVLLVGIAAAVGWWSTIPGAGLAGALGWPFYSGFVANTQGRIGITGRADAVAAVALIGGAVAAAAVHRRFTRPVADDLAGTETARMILVFTADLTNPADTATIHRFASGTSGNVPSCPPLPVAGATASPDTVMCPLANTAGTKRHARQRKQRS